MRYLPKSPSEREEMLDAIGRKLVEELFHSIPEKLRMRGSSGSAWPALGGGAYSLFSRAPAKIAGLHFFSAPESINICIPSRPTR